MSVTDYRESASETAMEAQAFEPESPFTEAVERLEPSSESAGFTAWAEAFTPFSESPSGSAESPAARDLAEALEQLTDESFQEALVDLVTETEAVIGERIADEAPSSYGDQRLSVGEAHLSPLTYEAHRYIESLQQSLAGLDVHSLSEQQLDEMLDRLDPAPGEVSPAGEEFLGALVRKAKSAVKWVAKSAVSVGKAALGAVGGVLKRLYGLVRPLLRRVLAMAIGRLPAPLRPAARQLARRFGVGEAEADHEFESEGESASEAAAVSASPEALAEEFDGLIAEVMTSPEAALAEAEAFAAEYESEFEAEADGRELEQLAEARSALVDALGSAQKGENLAPAIEQFVPALLAALRLGIGVVGRPKVVDFLAGYLSKLIGQWVGPEMASPLSSAIVDTGLRLISLESNEQEGQRDEAPLMLAATVEDTVRNLAEMESYVFEEEELFEVAVSEAFERAVATNFPARYVRPRLQQAPTLAGSFVQRAPRSVSPFRKYTRVPEVTVTEQLAASIKTFGGVSLAASLRAHGYQFPIRARMHIYEATVGTSLRRLTFRDRAAHGLAAGRRPWTKVHALTPRAAAALLQEPGLGRRVGSQFLRSRSRVAAGQRFYYLEPVGAATAPVMHAQGAGGMYAKTGPGAASVLASSAGISVARTASAPRPSQGWVTIDLIRSRVVVDLFLSEADAQQIAAASRRPGGSAQVVKALTSAWAAVARSFEQPDGRVRIVKELEEGEELLGSLLRRLPPALLAPLRRQIQEWVLRSLARWARSSLAEFARAAADPADGVTVRVIISGLPGLEVARSALRGGLTPAALAGLRRPLVARGGPQVTVAVLAGHRRRT